MKTILQIYPIMSDEATAKELQPIGRNSGAYQQMLANCVQASQTADRLGYWGICHTEHHFHSEGLEVSPDPGLLNLYLGMQTKNIRFGQLGYVLAARDPIRMAEETAMIDNMLKGRFFVGLARGYQRRWQNVLGQPFRVKGTISDQSDIDERNREVFEEHLQLMRKAWTEDSITWKSDDYVVPYPNTEWPAGAITREYGVEGEVDENNIVQRISVVPSPHQKPHPPLFQAFSVSPRTIQWCAEQDIIPTILPGPLDHVEELAQTYQRVAKENGRDYKVGEHVALVRDVFIVDNHDQIDEFVEKYERPAWEYFQHFGFYEAFRYPGEEGDIPKPGESLRERMINSDYLIIGTHDEVKDRVREIQSRLGFEYWVLLWHLGLMPNDVSDQQLERFAKVMDAVD